MADAADELAAASVMPGSPRPWVTHGGNLAEAVRQYGVARDAWLDLSTGINPHGYPVPPVEPEAWQHLPDDDDGLAQLAAGYYGAAHALPVAGSQAVIRALPALLPRATSHGTGIAALTYGEYLPAFERAGHRVLRYTAECDIELPYAAAPASGRPADFVLRPHRPLPAELRHLVLVNPNNPTATQFDPATLLDWHAQLAARGGSLIVDEAFADVTPHYSVAAYADRPGLVVLRSIGKFFGLAGARAGFVLAHPTWLALLRAELGPWTLSGPARAAVRAALQDQAWQRATLQRLEQDGARLAQLLQRHGLAPRATPLFAWVRHPAAVELQHRLAQHAIWVRRFDQPASLRLGLPAADSAWQRLDAALQTCAPLIAEPWPTPDTSR